jgi:hypothetical protein
MIAPRAAISTVDDLSVTACPTSASIY